MSADRMIRVNEIIKREIGTAIFRIMLNENFDLSTVTITKVETSPTLRSASVFVSIREGEPRRKTILNSLRRKRIEIQSLIAKNIKLKYTPKIEFKLDLSLEKGDQVLHLLACLEENSEHPQPNNQSEEIEDDNT